MIEHLLNKIHLGDCMEFMRQMPDKCVDLVLTDPPYGIGAENHAGKKENDWTLLETETRPASSES